MEDWGNLQPAAGRSRAGRFCVHLDDDDMDQTGEGAGLMRRFGMLAALAASAAIGVAPMAAQPALRPEPPSITAPARKKDKRRVKTKRRTPRIWSGGHAQSVAYKAKRRFHAGQSSTLKKTAKLLRLQAGRA